MKRNGSLIIGGVVVLLLLLYMVMFNVRFDEAAVVTTFGRASEGSVINADGKGAGWYLKLPWPIQDVRRYDTRYRVLETPPEQQQTKDKQVVVINDYVVWKIAEPLSFERSLKHVPAAEEQLRNRLRNARSLISRYNFDDLTNRDSARQKLAEAEQEMLKTLQTEVTANQYGVAILSLGIKRLVLPEEVTKKVFERMGSTRQMLAENALSEGAATAKNIRERATTARDRILAFAERRAQNIRAEGEAAAAKYYEAFKQDEEFAVFLSQVEGLRLTLKKNTTFLLDTKTAPFNLLAPAKPGGDTKPVNP